MIKRKKKYHFRKKLEKKPSKNVILDSALAMVFLLIFALIMIFGRTIFIDIEPDIRESVEHIEEANTTITTINERYPTVLDNLFMLLLVGLWIATMVASFLVDSHPIFFAFTIIILVFVLLTGAYMGNFYEEISLDSDINDVTGDFPMMHWIMTHLVETIILIAASILIALYGKTYYVR